MRKFLSSLVLASFTLAPLAEAGSFGLLPYGGDPLNGYVVVSAYPGATVTTNFILRNESDHDASYTVNMVDSTKTDTGDFTLKADSDAQIEMGAWGEVLTPSVSIPMGEYKIIQAKITVPETTALGEYWGGITAMEISGVADDGSAGAVSLIRNGIRVHLTVVAKEEYVPPVEPEMPDEAVASGNQYSKYIIPGILFFTAIFILSVSRLKKDESKSKKKKRK